MTLSAVANALVHSIQIVTGIEVNSESYFPKLREYCPSAEVTICFVIPLIEMET